MSRNLVCGIVCLTTIAVALPPPSFAQAKPVPVAATGAREFNVEQVDAMLARIALYPDELLTQTLMALTYPLQVVAASRWLEKDNNKNLKGDALARQGAGQREVGSEREVSGSVPQGYRHDEYNLEWTQQLGHAVATPAAAASGPEGRQPQNDRTAAGRYAGR